MPLQPNELKPILDFDKRLHDLIVRAALRDPRELKSKAARDECRKMSQLARQHLRRRAKFLGELLATFDKLQ